MTLLFALLAGLLFGFGLMISGMTDPTKVTAFLDIAGAWDPSLVLVMLGAISVSSIGFFFARRRTRSVLGLAMQIPTSKLIDRRLVLGSLAFGVGWGLAGFCPGPALVSLSSGYSQPIIFVAAMLVGMVLFELLDRRSDKHG
ncbi:YeeE/YedE family protein [Ectopseudomonas mendocina]|uniref:YeeE/YedE family protein n=1 Tax=Ectopseudomonas mendocina TaxID=300 RepID=A0ABZ2REA0_ECTME